MLPLTQIQGTKTNPNIMRDYKKFFTQAETAEFMASLLNPKNGDVVLEPSAGNGSLVKAIKNQNAKSIVFAFEIDQKWEQDLKNSGASVVVIKDFLQIPDYAKFSSCIANPPFGNNIDLKAHFDKICELVTKGGKIVMILPFDFNIPFNHANYPLENWSKNSDETVTKIKIVEFLNP